MKTTKTIGRIILSTLLIVFAPITFAADNWQYSIIVDAGSSGTRLHLFQYQLDADSPATNLPTIKNIPIDVHRIDTALASFELNPDAASTVLDSLFNEALEVLDTLNVNPKNVSVSIFATAGMRLLSEDAQNAIYAAIVKHLKQKYTFSSIKARTISGEEEGIYGWIAVNYLGNKFTNTSKTDGIINLGGASMQIVFAVEDTAVIESNKSAMTTIVINGNTYTLYHHSTLGLGINEAQKSVDSNLASYLCYPTGSLPLQQDKNSFFSFAGCSTLYSYILQNKLDKVSIPKQENFVVFGSGLYNVYKFFAPAIPIVLMSADSRHAALENNIDMICNTPWPWQNLAGQYSNEFLLNECTHGVYIHELIYGNSGYSLQDSQVQILNTLNQQSINWGWGALFYQIMNLPKINSLPSK